MMRFFVFVMILATLSALPMLTDWVWRAYARHTLKKIFKTGSEEPVTEDRFFILLRASFTDSERIDFERVVATSDDPIKLARRAARLANLLLLSKESFSIRLIDSRAGDHADKKLSAWSSGLGIACAQTNQTAWDRLSI